MSNGCEAKATNTSLVEW